LTIFVVYLFFITHGQNNYVGNYVEECAENSIQIYSDFTFKHTSYTNCAWTKGNWRSSNDTLYFVTVPIYDNLIYYDTLRFADSPKRVKIYSIVLSYNEKSSLVGKDDARRESQFAFFQNSASLPEKLFYKKNVLYDFDREGKIIKNKHKHDYGKKKFRSGYRKVKQNRIQ